MKKLLLGISILFLYLPAFTQGQLPNSDFEEWTNFTPCSGADSLIGYSSSSNRFYRTNSYCSTPTIVKSTDSYSGNYAAKLIPGTFATISYPPILMAGNNNTGRIPFTDRPSELTGYYKFNNGDKDTLTISMTLSKNGQVFASSFFRTATTTSEYSLFSIPLDYFTNDVPDSISLFAFVSQGYSNNVNSASYAFLDKFELNYTTTSIDPGNYFTSTLQITQNSGNLVFSNNVSDIQLIDLLGNTKLTHQASTQELNTSAINPGIYLLNYTFDGKTSTKKVVIN